MKLYAAVATALLILFATFFSWPERFQERLLEAPRTHSPVLASPVSSGAFSQLPPEVLEDLEHEISAPNYAFDGASAWNRPGGFSARYAGNYGMRVRHPADGWDVRMKLSSAREDSEAVAEGDTLYLDHGEGITERWANGPAGVEHAVIVDGPEALERAIFEVRTHLEPAVSPGGRGVEFRDVGGEVVFRYSGYRAIDATGKTLPSELTLAQKTSGTWRIALLADAAGARYPLTLDPLMSTTDGRLRVPFADRDEGDTAGYSVAVSGDRMVVGVPALLASGDGGSALVYRYGRGDKLWRREQTLTPADPVGGEGFGRAVDIWGTRVAVSALGRVLVYTLADGEDATWELLTTLRPVPDPDGIPSLFGFGESVALEGDLAFVGAPGAIVETFDGAGAVQAFRLPAETDESASVAVTFRAPSPQGDGKFGSSVSVGRGRLAVGAPRMNPSAGAFDAGTAFVFAFNPADLDTEELISVTTYEVDPPNDRTGARFGTSLSLDGDTLAVGSPNYDWPGPATPDSGVVDIFRFDPATDTWPAEILLAAPDATADDRFGSAVALSGDTLIVGAPEADFEGDDPGTAYVFERYQNGASPSGDAWGFAEKVRNSGTNFGFSAAASGDLFVIGAPSTSMSTGQVVPYTRRSTRWRETPINTGVGDEAIAIDQGIIAIGQPGLGSAGGRVRIGRRNDTIISNTETWSARITLDPPVAQAGQEFGAAVALKEPWLAVGAPGWSGIESNEGGRCYLYLHVGDDWLHVATYALAVPDSGDRFGSAVSITDRWLAIGSDGANRVRIYDRLRPDAGITWGFTQEFEGVISFGSAIALHPAGNLLAIASPKVGTGVTNVYELDSTRASDPWVYKAQISPEANGTIPRRSGTALAFRGDLLAIGEPGHPGGGRVVLHEMNRGPIGSPAHSWGIRHTLTVPDAPEDARLGTSVALADRFVIAGAPGYASPAAPETVTGAAFVFDPRRDTSGPGGATGTAITPHHTLIASRTRSSDRTGGAVAADGSEIAIAPPAGNFTGSTSVFTRQWWAWTPTPLGSFGDAGFQNGYAVDIEGDYLAFSVPFDDVDSKPGAGTVRLYKRNRTGFGGWGSVSTLFSPTPTISGNFGLSLGFSGNALLIGAPGEDGGEGTAYLFERNQSGADSWGMSRKFAPPGLQNGDDFGAACGIDADTIAIGSPGRATNTGSLFFYGKRLGAANPWVFHQETAPPLPAINTFFARSIAVQSHRVLAGATGTDLNLPNSGSAHLYGYTSEDTWGLIKTLLPSTQQTGSLFGFSVALDGPHALVGAPRHDHPSGIESGSATLFARDRGAPAAWGIEHTFYPASGETVPTAEHRFGWAVALRSRRAAISAPFTANTGAIHVFDQNATSAHGWDRISLLAATSGAQPGDQLGRALAIGPNTIVAGVPLHDRTTPILEIDRGRVLLFEETASTFTTYLQSHGLPTNADPLADPDHDGLTTLEEAHLNSDPTTPTPGFQARAFLRDGRPILQWREGKETHGTTSRILISTDLTTWTAPRTFSPRTIAEDTTTLTRQLTLENNPPPTRLFFHLEITRP